MAVYCNLYMRDDTLLDKCHTQVIQTMQMFQVKYLAFSGLTQQGTVFDEWNLSIFWVIAINEPFIDKHVLLIILTTV